MRKRINETSFDSRVLTGIPVVLAVVDAGSGNALGLTQSGVSRAIQRLEQRLNVRLFERNAKVMRLTDIGKQFCQEIAPLISRLQEIAAETTQSARAVRGRLRVNIDHFRPIATRSSYPGFSRRLSRSANRVDDSG
jgi:DNA-binding transcriptional LysR family regulator